MFLLPYLPLKEPRAQSAGPFFTLCPARRAQRARTRARLLLMAAAGAFLIYPVAAAGESGAAPDTMEVAHAVMVTVELDFGARLPTVAEAMKRIERVYAPEDGRGRTFAILEAFGMPTPDGKLLHLSLHVSTEKPGTGKIVFRNTGEVLWNCRIVPGTKPAPAVKNLGILVSDSSGNALVLDGSKRPAAILEASVRGSGHPLKDFWPDGTEREFAFMYSACGCPVKVKAKRLGERTPRTSDLPVIFPDDPSVVSVIDRLMHWQEDR